MVKIRRKILENNEHARMYFSRAELLSEGEQPSGFERGIPTDCSVADAFLRIRGISYIELHVYHVVVVKSAMWEWSEIERSILLLMSSLNSDLESAAGSGAAEFTEESK